MKKKLVSLILILALCVSLLSGCVLFERSNKNDYAQVVARIQNVQIGTEEKPETFSKEITKRDLVVAYMNFGQSIAQQKGLGIKDALDDVLDQLIGKELILARYQRMANNGDLESILTEARIARDYNKAWKGVYDYCDQQIEAIESSIYSNKGLTAPQKGTPSGEPQYPVMNMVSQREKEAQEKIDEEFVPELFTPNPLNIPKAGDDKRMTAIKNFVVMTIQQFSEIRLTKDEEALLQADKDFINDNSNKGDIYAKIMGNGQLNDKPVAKEDSPGFFCIRRLLAQSQFDQNKFERIQEFYTNKVKVTDEDIQYYYDRTLELQMRDFKKSNPGYLNTYYNALKDTSGTPFVFYHPAADVFYVKHILVPFSDAQKAAIEAYGKNNTVNDKTKFRDQAANSIMSYRHTAAGYDDLAYDTVKMSDIYNDVLKVMTGNKNNHYGAEWAFNNLIFKYNTDPGIFNNELGYLMPSVEMQRNGTASGYMKEFELAANELYEKHNPGDFLEKYAVTDYGVHLMYYSSNTGRFGNDGIVKLFDWTSPLKLRTYYDALKEHLEKVQSFDLIQGQIINEYTVGEASGKYVKKYERRYADLWKAVERRIAAEKAANPNFGKESESAGDQYQY